MSTATRNVIRAGGALARDRLAAYRRYADLVRQEEDALAAGDVDGYRALADEALHLQEEFGHGVAPAFIAQDPESGTDGFVDELSHLLQGALSASERIQARLGALRSDAAASVRRASEGQRRVRSYAVASGSGDHPHLDLTL